MRLLIKEYLSLLKEDKELDKILPDLLTAMDFVIQEKPQKGVRQHGVDLSAIGKDKNGEEKIFLFVIKQGDITRQVWDGNEDAVRSSLNEIKDTYINKYIDGEKANLITKIILCTGGEMPQNTREQWIGYKKQNTTERIEYEFWGGYELSDLFCEHLLTENLFPIEEQSLLRKTLVSLSDSAYDMSDFYKLYKLQIEKKYKNEKAYRKFFAFSNLILNIIYKWACDSGNLKPALLASERILLNLWDFMRKNEILDNPKIQTTYFSIIISCTNVFNSYIQQFTGHYSKRNGLAGLTGTGSSKIETIMIFEHLGFLSIAYELNEFIANNTKSDVYINNSKVLSDAICFLVQNQASLWSPVFDEQVIEINLAMLSLMQSGKEEEIKFYLQKLMEGISFSYKSGIDYFVCSNSFSDLEFQEIKNREELTDASSLLFFIGFWASILSDKEIYNQFFILVKNIFPHTAIQYWYPDNDSEEVIYSRNISMETGYSLVVHDIPEEIDEFKKTWKTYFAEECDVKTFSCIEKAVPVLLFISNRHFRNPFFTKLING